MLTKTLLSMTFVYKVISDTCEAPEVDHGFVSGSGDHSRWTGKVTCEPRFILLGANHLKCLHGQWNGQAPRCVDMMGCDNRDLLKVSNGWMTQYRKKTYRGSVWHYHCHPGWTLMGSDQVWCDSGQWNYHDGQPACVKSGCDGIDENKMKERKIKIMDQEGSDASVILSFSCGSGIQDRKYGRLFCNGSHWHGDTSLCEVEEIITLKHQESINNEELVYSTLSTNEDENEEIFILENDNCQQQRCFKSEAQKQASNCLFNLLLFLTLLLTNYN